MLTSSGCHSTLAKRKVSAKLGKLPMHTNSLPHAFARSPLPTIDVCQASIQAKHQGDGAHWRCRGDREAELRELSVKVQERVDIAVDIYC